MYREPPTKKTKQKSPSQTDPLAPARSAVQRQRPRRSSSHLSRPEPSLFIPFEERLESELLREARLNGTPLPPNRPSEFEIFRSALEARLSPRMHENVEREYRSNDFEGLTGVRGTSSTHEADPILSGDDSRFMTMRVIHRYPNISSDDSEGLPASLNGDGESFTPISREAQRQIRLITRMARHRYRRRDLPRAEGDSLGDRRPDLARAEVDSLGNHRRDLSRVEVDSLSVRRRDLALEEVDGLGDRRRSVTPEGYSWETLHSTITPDERLPSVHSSFTSTDALLSTSDPTPHTTVSHPTNRNRAVCTILSIHSFIEESASEEGSDTS